MPEDARTPAASVTPMINGGRACPSAGPWEFFELTSRLTGTLSPMTTPLNARHRLATLPRYTTLNGEDFTGQVLASARPSELRFTRCSFAGVDLRQATLDGCSFKFCDLSGADLRGASLRGVWLSGCDLRDADLRDADLTEVEFGRVNSGRSPYGLTDVTGVRLKGAVLRNVQLDDVIGWPSEADNIA